MKDYLEQVDELKRDVDIRDLRFFIKYKDNPIKGGAPIEEDWYEFTTVGENRSSKTQGRVRSVAPTKARPNGGVEWFKMEPAYLAWKADREAPLDGTPIELWEGFSEHERTRLSQDFSVRTLEQVVAMNDGQIARSHIPDMRNRIKAIVLFLEANARSVEIDKGFEERDAMIRAQRDALEEQKAQMEEMRQQIAALAAAKEEPTEEPKRGPGRPKKEAA